MKIHILTCFPEFFNGTFCSLLAKAIQNKILSVNIIDLKKYGIGRHKKIDDCPYGGGDGLIMMPEVVENAINGNFDTNLLQEMQKNGEVKMLIPSPRGEKLTHQSSQQIAQYKEIIFLCNRYEGVDQRIIDYYNFKQICVGEYILMGGEVASMCIIESTCRFVDGVIKNKEVLKNETFSNAFENNLEHNQYTKPRVWNNLSVPDVLLSGNHAQIAKWKGKKK